MGAKASSSYELGTVLGMVSVQVSRIDKDPGSFLSDLNDNVSRIRLAISGLVQATDFVHTLANLGIGNLALGALADPNALLDFDTDPANFHLPDFGSIQGTVESVRSATSTVLHQNPQYATVYDLGVSLGLAEGQASTSDPAALVLAVEAVHDAISEAKAAELHGVVDPELLTNMNPITYAKIVSVRVKYANTFNKTHVI
jgi:hypothetical protein